MKFRFLLMLAMFFVGVSCSNDDKETPVIGDEFDGVYKGELSVDVNDSPFVDGMLQKVYVTKSGDNMFKVELRNFVIMDLNIGDIVVEDINVESKGDECSFVGADNLDLAVGSCDVDVTGSIKDESLNMVIIVSVLDPDSSEPSDMKVSVDFVGDKMDADQSSEAKLLTFEFDLEDPANQIVTSQPVIDGTNVTFTTLEDATTDQLKALVPSITISENATITPANGVSADFNSAVEYVVTSEDGIYTTTYKAYVAAKSLKYTFNEWETINYLFDFEQVAPIDILESANRGTAFLSLYGFAGDSDGNKVNTVKTEGVDGYGAKMITFDSRSISNSLVPGITAGTLYIGKFNVGAAMSNRLETTEFGLLFNKKEPILFKGQYKYTPGEVFYDASNYEDIQEVANKVDECSIMAVLFEVENEDDVLTGVDINTSDKRVAVASLADGSAKSEWTSFELDFDLLDGKEYDSNKMYKIAFVSTSSKEGDLFKGAPGSALYVDEFEIVYKLHD